MPSKLMNFISVCVRENEGNRLCDKAGTSIGFVEMATGSGKPMSV